MVAEKLGATNLRKGRFVAVSIKRRKWEPESEYKWEVIDERGEVKPQKFLFKKDALSAITRLRQQHKDAVKVARGNVKRDRAKG